MLSSKVHRRIVSLLRSLEMSYFQGSGLPGEIQGNMLDLREHMLWRLSLPQLVRVAAKQLHVDSLLYGLHSVAQEVYKYYMSLAPAVAVVLKSKPSSACEV